MIYRICDLLIPATAKMVDSGKFNIYDVTVNEEDHFVVLAAGERHAEEEGLILWFRKKIKEARDAANIGT